TSQDGTKWAGRSISHTQDRSALKTSPGAKRLSTTSRVGDGRQMDRGPYSTRSSSARSGRSAPWVGRWTITMPSSAMSPTSTRVTPRGRSGRGWAPGRDLGDGEDVAAQGGDGPLLHGELGRALPQRGGRDQRLDLQLGVDRPGAAARHGVRPDPPPAGAWRVFGSVQARCLIRVGGSGSCRRQGGLELGAEAGSEDV